MVIHLEEGDGELPDPLGEVSLQDAAAQAVVPHQPPSTVLAQVEVLHRDSTTSVYTRLPYARLPYARLLFA